MFEVSIDWHGVKGKLKFDKGRLTGDKELLSAVRFEAQFLEYFGEPGNRSDGADVLHEEAYCYLFLQIMFNYTPVLVAGKVPKIEHEDPPT